MSFFTLTYFRASLSRLGAVVLLGLAAGRAHAQAPSWASVQRTGSAAGNVAYSSSVAVAADGSQLVTGNFTGTLTLGASTLTPGAGSGHIFLAKYSAAGTVLWAAKLDGSTSFLGSKVAVDAVGNVYLAGSFNGSLTLGSTTFTSTSSDGFLAKYDAQGVLQWARQGGATSGASATGLATDASGNVTVVGYSFGGLAFGGSSLSRGAFLYRFSPTGTVLLAKRVSNSNALANDVALDGAGNAYITGYFTQSDTFDTTTLTSAGNEDIFLCKVGPTGTSLWAQRAGGPNADRATSVAVDAGGNAVVGGGYDASNATTFVRFYAARFSPQGVAQWTQLTTPSASSFFDRIEKVVYDNRGGFYVTGGFQGTVVFGSTALTGIGDNTLFLVRYDSQGNVAWAGQSVNSSASSSSKGVSLAPDAAGNVYVMGNLNGSVGFGALPVSTGGSADAFVAKVTAGAVLAASHAATAGIALQAYPNPASGSATLVLPTGGGRLAVLDALGRVVRQQILPATAGPSPVALAGLAPGLYQLRALLGNGKLATATLQVR